MTNALVNSVYPITYFGLPGVDEISYPDTFWWASKERYATVAADGVTYVSAVNGGARTSEILEIDLGRIREVNYINFDVIRAPLDIKIEYDEISTPDRDAVWVPVSPIDGQPFNKRVSFDSNIRNSWLNAEYQFTDSKGHMVHTRYLRITFSRRDDAWPTATNAAFQWSVFVKHLRIGRNITTYLDTVGPLLAQDTPLGLTPVSLEHTGPTATREARQQFVVPESSVRAGVTPNMLGFGVLINVSPSALGDSFTGASQVSYRWSVWDVSNEAAPTQLGGGVENVAVTDGLTWLDWYLDQSKVIPGDTLKVYELRVSSLNSAASDTVFTHSPNVLSNKLIPGTLTFTHGSATVSTTEDTRISVRAGDFITRTDIPDQIYEVSAVGASTITLSAAYAGSTASSVAGVVLYPFVSYSDGVADYVEDATQNLVMRVWADIADEGRDVLGNAYRYVTRTQSAANVLNANAPGWMSDPVPSPDAVESLYFDIRGTDAVNNDFIPSILDAISIAPRTPGVRMNVYYTLQGLQGERPKTTEEWDYLLWTPIHETYTLRRDEVIQLPHAIRAAFIKLEFTALNPLPYRLPTFPPMPPKNYRRFPTWVEDQFNNTQIRNLIEDWFLRNATPVETKVLATISDPVREFEYKQREFLAALALGTINDQQIVNSGLVDVADKAIIDPTTASKVYVSFDNQFQNSLLLSVDQNSVLGQMVVQRFDPNTITDQNEQAARSMSNGIPYVSTTNNRVSESYQSLAQTPMRFNKVVRHVYTVEQASFNKKAYFVGIEQVRFLRNNYATKRDDALITGDLYDDYLILENTFAVEEGTTIPDGALVYVSYQVGLFDVVDEPVVLAANAPVALAQGGGPARNVLVYTAPNKQGTQFFQTQDYELSYGSDVNFQRVNYIQRSPYGERFIVAPQPVVYVDGSTVTGHTAIPTVTEDSAVVIGVAMISAASEGLPDPTYGVSTYGADGATYEDLHTP